MANGRRASAMPRFDRQALLAWYDSQSYYSCHVAYILGLSMFGAIVLHLFETGNHHFINSLFMSTSAVTQTGLIVIDISLLSTLSQVVLWLLMSFGGVLLFSIFPPLIRLKYVQTALDRQPSDTDATSLLVEREALVAIIRIALAFCFFIPFSSFLFFGIYASTNPVSQNQ